MNYKKINNYLGWLVFLIATTVYFITIEDTVSLWDCGEYITAAYKLEVGHPPGAPLFMVLGRLSSFFAAPENVAVWINRLSAVSSSATILFMFWSITLLVKKISLRDKKELTPGDKVAILGSGLVGALAYTFSDSFWFSAVEGEVYAMSSLFTALIFWAILKWDEEMMEIKNGRLNPTGYSPDRWLLFIMFTLGLAIGVHLLGILVVPAIGYTIYYRYGSVNKRFFHVFLGLVVAGLIISMFTSSSASIVSLVVLYALVIGLFYGLFLWSRKQKVVEFFLVGLMTLFILVFIQEGVIPGSISMASSFEIGFVTALGMPFYSGTIFFFVGLIVLFVFLLRYSRKKENKVLYSSIMGLMLLMIGFGSFAVIVIRSNANTPLDENDPENLVSFHSYLKRDQYGSAPLLFGNAWNSKENGGKWETRGEKKSWVSHNDDALWDDQSPIHLRRFIVTKNGGVLKAFKDEKLATEYAKKKGAIVEETYFESNAGNRENAIATYSQTMFFPRMYWTQDQARVESYKEWSGYDPNDELAKSIMAEAKAMNIPYSDHPKVGKDQNRLPTAGENFSFFFKYQVNWMYTRYFLWNFAGRQNDIQGSRGGSMRGNWKSGFSMVDDARLGDQSAAPYFTKDNPANNSFFFLPLILGLIGLFFHFYRTPKDAFVVFLAFLFTGVAIVVYLNQKTLEPRERDYAFAGSFYFFTMWIGIGVYALYDAFKSFGSKEFTKMGIIGGAGLVLFAIMDWGGALVSMPSTISWLIIFALGAAVIAAMIGLRSILKEHTQGALVATMLTLCVPLIMAVQGWDDHDRSLKTSAHDLAYNYLSSCQDNGILFTNGDNDTFPLWYMQEVEGKFTSIRVCNLSLMQTDWYTDQMKMKAYESEALPIQFREDQILMNSGGTDQVLFQDLFNLVFNSANPRVVKEIIALRIKQNKKLAIQATEKMASSAPGFLAGTKGPSPETNLRVAELTRTLGKPLSSKLVDDIYSKLSAAVEIFKGIQDRTMQFGSNAQGQGFQDLVFKYEEGWNVTNLEDAMAFVRNDDNMVTFNTQALRVFPSSEFVYPVNKENAVKSKVISPEQVDECVDEIKFKFTAGGLTREQVMMLDIIANNHWERPIYFSSPRASKVGDALYKGLDGSGQNGYVKQNGMAFELTPLVTSRTIINRERMYDNMMKNYHYGEMNNPDVLTDYYTRRHTVQYRSHFLRLSRDYAVAAANADRFGVPTNDSLIRPGQLSEAENAEYKKRAIALVKKSLEVMPAEFIIDYGEPNGTGYLPYQDQVTGERWLSYTDGVLHDYVEVLLLAGDKKEANRLGNVVCDQLESIINYYDKSNVAITSSTPHNMKDMYAALEAYFKMYKAVNDADFGDPNGKLAKRINSKLDEVYNTIRPSILTRMEALANDRGEVVNRGALAGPTANRLFAIEDQLNAIGYSNGYLEMPVKVAPQRRGTPAGGGQAPAPFPGQQ
jgi:hypothetical protein